MSQTKIPAHNIHTLLSRSSYGLLGTTVLCITLHYIVSRKLDQQQRSSTFCSPPEDIFHLCKYMKLLCHPLIFNFIMYIVCKFKNHCQQFNASDRNCQLTQRHLKSKTKFRDKTQRRELGRPTVMWLRWMVFGVETARVVSGKGGIKICEETLTLVWYWTRNWPSLATWRQYLEYDFCLHQVCIPLINNWFWTSKTHWKSSKV